MHDERPIPARPGGGPPPYASARGECVYGPDTLTVHFQPIVSLRRGAVVGLEALARGIAVNDGVSSPGADGLFAGARASGRLRELEEACRRIAIERFARLAPAVPGTPLLFLNVLWDPDAASGGPAGANRSSGMDLARLCRAAGLDPRRVVLEIVESRAADESRLGAFVERRRQEGFLIALDDFGQEHSNLARLASLRPDILKIDRHLVHGLLRDELRRELVRSLVQMGRRIGALVVAEGVETEEDLVEVSVLGVDLLQGYGVARPAHDPPRDLPAAIPAAAALYRDRMIEAMAAERARIRQGRAILSCLRDACLAVRPGRMEEALRRMVERSPGVDGAFVLDHTGRQRTGTVLGRPDERARRDALFAPAEAGSDHSRKDYFLRALHEGDPASVTEPYVSSATGRLCVTLAARFHAQGEAAFSVLCLDLLASEGRRP